MAQRPLVSIVTPFYNEGEGVKHFYQVMGETMEKLPDFDFEIVCVDDGSRDNTLEQLIAISKADPRVTVLEFSRNFGKEPAMTAGIDAAAGDCVIPIDADLQDPPGLISEMLKKWQEGAEVVLAKRVDRSSDSYAKRTSALIFYRLHNALSH
jgi:glycosyltransferase involved in cell wall biosynthesis